MWPSVSVLVPTLDEEARIGDCLASLSLQDYPGPWDVVVIDGGSRDATLERVRSFGDRLPGLTVLRNPAKVQSEGLNLAARQVAAEVLVRADAHAVYATDYVTRSVEALRSGAEHGVVAAGGPLRAEGTTPFGRAVAAAMALPLATGPARFHRVGARAYVDTVYLGAFPRHEFLAIGGYRTLPSKVAEDADLYWRWRRAGRRILLDPSIMSTYRPRESFRRFARQQFRYGRGKAELWWIEHSLPSWRPLAPFLLVAGLTTGAVGVATGHPRLLRTVAVPWAAVVAGTSLSARQPVAVTLRLPVVVATMHLAYGLGMAAGLVHGPIRLASVASED